MTRSQLHPILQELQDHLSPASQLAALKALKNELIGHEQRKKIWIDLGVIPTLASILSSRRAQYGKRASRGVSGQGSVYRGEVILSDEDASRLQTAVIIGSLAQAGPQYVVSILNGKLLGPLMSIISSADTAAPPVVLVLAVLKTLHAVADNLPPHSSGEWLVDQQLANLLYSKEHIVSIARIIGDASRATGVQHAVSLAISLICKTCTDERQKDALVEVGVLTILATRLASFVVSQGFVLPGAESYGGDTGAVVLIPQPASLKAPLAPTLKAISILINQSKHRTKSFLSSPAILAVFPKPHAEFSPTDVKKAPWGNSTYLSGTAVPRHSTSNPIDALLPLVPATSAKISAEHTNFPPLGTGGPLLRKRSSFQASSFPGDVFGRSNASDEEESPVVAWLIYLIRADSGMCRLMAAELLVGLFALGFTRKSRASTFCILLVPLLIRMLDRDYEAVEYLELSDLELLPLKFRIQEAAPAILATLVMDSQRLQKAAVDCHAIKRLSQLLKETFDPIPGNDSGLWFPDKALNSFSPELDADIRRGEGAPSPLARHTMRLREGILQALASIAPFDDDYKKAICDQGVVPYIIESLKPYSEHSHTQRTAADTRDFVPGNAAPTLLAACGAARVLTRSVSVLRTSLIDAGVGPPLFALLNYNDVEVQIAATKVVSNLAVDFSPMKDAIIQHNVIKSLCEHSHSANARLRLESLWALKHLVLNSSNDLKITVVQHLGSDWIKHLISTDPTDSLDATLDGTTVTAAVGNAADRNNDSDSTNAGSERHKKNVAKGRQQILTEKDHDHIGNTAEDDTAIQAELFDLLRNLFCGEEAAEMIDYVLKAMGQKDFFEIMLDRIRPKTIAGPTLKDTKTTPAASDVIIKVLYVIVHIAASLPKFRSVVASQTNLLRQILIFLSHSNREVRVQCCWIAINLTYADEESDRVGCRQRALELHRLGYLTKLMAMAEDIDLDVRERTKTAVDLIGAHVQRG